MNREIKFRAWMNYGNHAEMIDNVQNHITGSWAFGYLIENRADGVDVSVMQYTGLKDRNGVEIYEGDIFSEQEHVWEKPIFVSVSYDADSAKYVTNLANGDYAGDLEEWCECQVIGNIHQNQELLK